MAATIPAPRRLHKAPDRTRPAEQSRTHTVRPHRAKEPPSFVTYQEESTPFVEGRCRFSVMNPDAARIWVQRWFVAVVRCLFACSLAVVVVVVVVVFAVAREGAL